MLNLELWKKFKSLLQLHNLFTYVHMLFFYDVQTIFFCCRKSSSRTRKRWKVYTEIHFVFFFLTELASSWHDVCARDWVKIKFDVWLSVTQHAHLNENSRWLMMILAAVVIFEGEGEKTKLLSSLSVESFRFRHYHMFKVEGSSTCDEKVASTYLRIVHVVRF